MREGWWPRAWCGLVASVAAPERAAAEPYLPVPYGWWLRAQVSRDAPPPLPGGYKAGEKVFYTGASQTLPSGNKLVHGQQGEVTGPGTTEASKDKLNVLFPGNKGSVICALAEVRRLHAASAATPLACAPHTRRCPRAPCVMCRGAPCLCAAAPQPSPHA